MDDDNETGGGGPGGPSPADNEWGHWEQVSGRAKMKPVPRQGKPTAGWTVDYKLLDDMRKCATTESAPAMEDIEWVILELFKRGYVQISK